MSVIVPTVLYGVESWGLTGKKKKTGDRILSLSVDVIVNVIVNVIARARAYSIYPSPI